MRGSMDGPSRWAPSGLARGSRILAAVLWAPSLAAALAFPRSRFLPPPGKITPGCGKTTGTGTGTGTGTDTRTTPVRSSDGGPVYCVPQEQVDQLHDVED